MKVSPHIHAESPLTGSTIGSMVSRAKDLGRTHIAYTDQGHLSSVLKVYAAAKKKGLKFIPGIELFFKDIRCPIIAGTPADRAKYFTLSLYCQDQEAYQALSRLVSNIRQGDLEVNGQRQQLWAWENLKEISKFNVNIVLGGPHCMVGKPMLAGRPDLANEVLKKLLDIFGPNRVFAALLCEPWVKNWSEIIEIQYKDGSKDTVFSSDHVTTDRARRIKASDLVGSFRHKKLLSKTTGGTYFKVDKDIDRAISHKGFLPLPGGDVTLRVNKLLRALATRYKLTLLVTDYAYYANAEDKIVQSMRLEGAYKLHPNLHMKGSGEILHYLIETLGLTPEESAQIIENNEKWASLHDNLQLKYDWRLADVGENPLKMAMDIVRENGRMQWDNPEWTARLKEELEVIARNPKKDLTAYFLPIRDVLNHYRENGLLTGPGRGSAGGSLLMFLLGITQINPFKYDLPFSRFFSLDRIMLNKLPDVDVDLEDRTLLVGEDGKSGYMYSRWGDKAAQISTRTTLRLKSAIKDTNRYFHGEVEPEIEAFTKGLPAPPQGVSDLDFIFGFDDEEDNHIPGLIEQSKDLKNYSETRPKEWEIVSKAMGITRAFSQHASAFVLSDIPIKDIVPVKDDHITQYEAKECESAGLIKYDFLVVKQLKDLRVCLDLINKRNKEEHTVGYFSHDGQKTFIWDLPEIPEVFRSVWGGATETCFQINSRSMTPFVMDILPEDIVDLATILALVRPGPLDFIDPKTGRTMAAEYVMRRKGESEPDIKVLAEILPKTYGIFVYQEQLGQVAKELAGFSGSRAEILRENMAKKKKVELMKMRPEFIEGASKKVPVEVAEEIWEQMETFGRYGFSVIHAVEYAHITYACMFLKHLYPLEWWAAVLTNAEEREITGEFWRYVKDMVLPPDINLSGEIMAVDYQNQKIRSKLGVMRGVGDKTIEPIVNGRPYTNIQDFVDKKVAGPSLSHKLVHAGILDSLFPAGTDLIAKLKMFEDAVEIKSFREKSAKATAEGRKLRAIQPKEGTVPEHYMNLHPIVDAAMKKAVLPSMIIDLHALGKKFSRVKNPQAGKVTSKNYKATLLLDGERLRRLDEIDGASVVKDQYVASTAFIVEASEFDYAKGAKRALKLILDSDGYMHEKVLWPDYDTGMLLYPETLKKGVIATVFLKKRAGRKDMSITEIVVETENK